MDTRGVIGQKIVSIRQRRVCQSASRAGYTDVEFIELANGVRLYPNTIETEDEYGHDFVVNRVYQKENRRATVE
jgi:hypothetical protein